MVLNTFATNLLMSDIIFTLSYRKNLITSVVAKTTFPLFQSLMTGEIDTNPPLPDKGFCYKITKNPSHHLNLHLIHEGGHHLIVIPSIKYFIFVCHY